MQTKHIPTQLAPNACDAALAVGWFGANLFGPQSPWSSLLSQREHLQREIKRGRKYLEQLRKDLTACSGLLQAWPADEQRRGNGWMPKPAQQAAATDAMEQFLVGWLEQLEERLGAVVKEIENIETHPGLESFNPEESMFELLRAAG